MAKSYEEWLGAVLATLDSINMPMVEWQGIWVFDFRAEYDASVKPDDAAMKANRYWWQQQNKSLKRDCRQTKDCWLPSGHQGQCQPVSDKSAA